MFSVARRTLGFIMLSALFLSAACSDEPAAGPTSGESKKVTMVLPFGPTGTDAPWFVGIEQGFFEDEGIELEILPGTSGDVAVTALATGESDITNVDVSTLVLAKDREPDMPVKLVSSLYDTVPWVVMSLADGANLDEPQDLEGQLLHANTGTTLDDLVTAWAGGQGIAGIKFKEVDAQALRPLLLEKKIDAWVSFVTETPMPELQEEAGVEVVSLLLGQQEGLDQLYGNGIAVNTDFADENPELVQGFLRAAFESYRYALENQEEAAALMQREFPTTLEADTLWRLGFVEQLVYNDGAVSADQIGALDEARIAASVEFVTEAFDLPGELTAEDIFSTEYLP